MSSSLQFLSLSLYVKYISPEEFGEYALVILVATILMGLSNFGLLTVYQRDFFKYQEEAEKDSLLFSIILFIMLNILFYAIILWFFSSTISIFFFSLNIPRSQLLMGFLFISVKQLNQLFYTKYKNQKKAMKYMWFNTFESVISFLLTLSFLVFLEMKIQGLLLAQMVTVSIVFIYQLTEQFFLKNPTFNKKILYDSLLLGLPLAPSNILKVLGNQFDKFMINLMSNLGGVGIYDIGQKIGNITFTFTTALQNIFFPNVLKRFFSNNKKLEKATGKYLTPFFYLSTLFAMLNLMFVEELMSFISQDEYKQAIPISMLFSLLYGTHFFTKQPQLLFAKKTKIISAISIFIIILNILLNIPFIYYFEIIGAAYATVISGFTFTLLIFFYSQKYARINWEYTKIITIYVIFFASFISLFLMFHFEIEYLIRLIYKAIFIIVYLIIGWKFEIISMDKINNLLNSRNRLE